MWTTLPRLLHQMVAEKKNQYLNTTHTLPFKYFRLMGKFYFLMLDFWPAKKSCLPFNFAKLHTINVIFHLSTVTWKLFNLMHKTIQKRGMLYYFMSLVTFTYDNNKNTASCWFLVCYAPNWVFCCQTSPLMMTSLLQWSYIPCFLHSTPIFQITSNFDTSYFFHFFHECFIITDITSSIFV